MLAVLLMLAAAAGAAAGAGFYSGTALAMGGPVDLAGLAGNVSIVVNVATD